MYYRVNDFIEDWSSEEERTCLVFSMVPEAAKSVIVCDQVRSLDRLAYHIIQGIVQMGSLSKLIDILDLPDDPLPATMVDSVSLYRCYHKLVKAAILERWTDGMLRERISLYGQDFRRGDVLSLLINHEIHHRSQLTVIMRLAGLKVPGLYGPVSEDWEQMGLPIPK